MMPSGIQRRAPLTPLPMKGTQHDAPAAAARRRRSSGESFSQNATGTCTATSAATTAMRDEQHVARQEVGRRVARELRVVGQRDRGAVDHHQAEREQRDDDADERAVEAEQARRLAAVDADPFAHRDRLGDGAAAAPARRAARAGAAHDAGASARRASAWSDARRSAALMRPLPAIGRDRARTAATKTSARCA